MYRECKEICKAAEKGEEDINLDHLIADFKDETATNTAEVKGSPDQDTSRADSKRENMRKRDVPLNNFKTRGRPKMTSSQKEEKKRARERGEAIQIRGYMGKEYEQVFDD